MNGKIKMEITINPLVSPLLYERLSRCTTARERAAVFRSLAEGHLRAESMQRTGASHLQAALTTSAHPKTSRLSANEVIATEGFQTLSADDAAHLTPKFSVELLNQLAGYLD
ncbi:hypothetical protein M3I53_34950 [Paraburkholderia sp. CNPSo 3272]|uniref:hypothetical protein n=1 Tax=Paraburkholderia sp. CNPSo 3272 TaxID=2940931 RepID=UPI0020B639C2|nr:hypothetical protein [Paraburkholderia sp. CNPSo 3272]MCP3728249.1 hypothetical protein [Paraburkholderia sp. CNPSo 3272]